MPTTLNPVLNQSVYFDPSADEYTINMPANPIPVTGSNIGPWIRVVPTSDSSADVVIDGNGKLFYDPQTGNTFATLTEQLFGSTKEWQFNEGRDQWVLVTPRSQFSEYDQSEYRQTTGSVTLTSTPTKVPIQFITGSEERFTVSNGQLIANRDLEDLTMNAQCEIEATSDVTSDYIQLYLELTRISGDGSLDYIVIGGKPFSADTAGTWKFGLETRGVFKEIKTGDTFELRAYTAVGGGMDNIVAVRSLLQIPESTRFVSADTPFDCDLPHNAQSFAVHPQLFPDPEVSDPGSWALQAGTVFYDATVGRTTLGSWRFEGESTSTSVISELFAPTGSGFYKFSFFVKGTMPRLFGAQTKIYPGASNLAGFTGDIGSDTEWTEVTLVFYLDDTGIDWLSLQVFAANDPELTGPFWVDDFTYQKLDNQNPTYIEPPAVKRVFNSNKLAIDCLGNTTVNGIDDVLFFMHTDKSRPNYDVIAAGGWDGSIWEANNAGVQKAVDSGMLAAIQGSLWIQNGQAQQGDVANFNAVMDGIIAGGNLGNLLFFWWDHENDFDQWQVYLDIINAYRIKDPQGPVIVLNGNAPRANGISQFNLQDLCGGYQPGQVGVFDDQTTLRTASMQTMRDSPVNISPGAFSLISGISDNAGSFRMRVFEGFIQGARFFSYYGDNVVSGPAIPVETQIWWPDSLNVITDIKNALEVSKRPHWTNNWSASPPAFTPCAMGTRENGDTKYIILVNQDTPELTNMTIQLSGSHGKTAGTDVLDYYTKAVVGTLNGSLAFDYTVPGIGVGQGSAILEIP